MPCAKCGAADASKKCGQCHVVSYCSRECQRDHWKTHKKQCSALAKAQQEKENGQDNDKAGTNASAGAVTAPAPTSNGSAATSQATAAAAKADAAPAAPKPATSAAPSDAQPTATATKAQQEQAQKALGNPLPSEPYKPPPNLSDIGRQLFEQLRTVLLAPPEAIGEAILGTPFAESVSEQERKVDMAILPKFHDLLRETMAAEPTSAIEPMKRMLAVKRLVRHPDDCMFANWLWVIAQNALSAAQRLKFDVVSSRDPSTLNGNTIEMPKNISARMAALRRDALIFLEIAFQMFKHFTQAKDPRLAAGLPPEGVARLAHGIPTLLGYALRHQPGPESKKRRQFFWTGIADTDSKLAGAPDALSRGLSAYALAYEACCDSDEAKWRNYMDVARQAWAQTGGNPMPSFIERQLKMGCTEQTKQEMQGVMDGNELKLVPQRTARDAGKGGPAASASPSSGVGAAPAKSSGKGARLVPGRGPLNGDRDRTAAGAGPEGREQVSQLEEEMRGGYALYESNRMEEGIAHFAKVLKKAYALPLTGMSISVIFSLSHAHIEGCAQLRRWSQAEDTCLKLKEIAEYAMAHDVPQAIPTVGDRLHLWWREKRANLFSRRKRFDKTQEILAGMEPHAQALGPRFISAHMSLTVCCHAELFMQGSPAADVVSLQACIDKGVAALREEPPPAGGARDGSLPVPVQQWVSETKLETWVKVLPLLRSIEYEGLQLEGLESVLAPLADKFGMEIGETALNAETLVKRMATHKRSVWKPGNLNMMTLMFGFAVLLPILLALWLVVQALSG